MISTFVIHKDNEVLNGLHVGQCKRDIRLREIEQEMCAHMQKAKHI